MSNVAFQSNPLNNSRKERKEALNSLQLRHFHYDIKAPDFSDVMDPRDSKRPNRNNRRFAYSLSQSLYGVAALLTVKSISVHGMRMITTPIWMRFRPPVELALSDLEIDQVKLVKGNTKPIFVRRRSPKEIAAAEACDAAATRDPETDLHRFPNREWQIMDAVCTHMGCVPYPNEGFYENGFFCPCHGSHYDRSGRIMEGPANFNLPVFKDYKIEGDSITFE